MVTETLPESGITAIFPPAIHCTRPPSRTGGAASRSGASQTYRQKRDAGGDQRAPYANAFRSVPATSSTAARALSRKRVMRRKPWNMPLYRVSVTGTPASRSRAA
jgi:hypothetical protein